MSPELPIIQFGLDAATMDSCAVDILKGNKRATTGLLAAYRHDAESLPKAGVRSLVRDSRNRDIAIIEVTQVETRLYREVDATYAAIEGEGDKSLSHWQRVHWEFLGLECARIGIPMNEAVAVVLEYFKVEQTLLTLDRF
jgi:uncharacterized protein YhfF|uniref:ASCH domain-containing protein n=1 Tax=Cephaloticoccus sp. TaxID=1985742 RepID=UPI00404B86AE